MRILKNCSILFHDFLYYAYSSFRIKTAIDKNEKYSIQAHINYLLFQTLSRNKLRQSILLQIPFWLINNP